MTGPGAPPEGELLQPTATRAEADPLAEQRRRRIAAAPRLIEVHGYLRAGIGTSNKGGDQVAFRAPGAASKYRLGNEAETYGELALDNNWINPDHGDAWFKTAVTLAVVAPRNGTFDVVDQLALREAYGEAGQIAAAYPEMTVWAGQRFYRRRDVHITDFFYNDMSGYGAGFQQLAVGDRARLAVAYLGGSVDNDDSVDIGNPIKNTLDVRLSDIPLAGGSLELWLIPTLAVGDRHTAPDLNRSGIGGGAFWSKPLLGGFNEVSVSFGHAGAANLSADIDPGGIARDGWLARVVERATIQASPRLSMQWTGVLQLDNRNGSTTGSAGNVWFSAGVRPVYSLGKYTGIAVEAGVDIVAPEAADGEDARTGALGKITIAPLIRPGTDFWARPELRAFVTAAFWNEPIQGQRSVGGPAYDDDTFGLTAGVQMESWW